MKQLLVFCLLAFIISSCERNNSDLQPTNGSAPTILSFQPITGSVGSTVTINGNHFDSVHKENNVVKFNGVTAVVSEATGARLKVTVPTGATTGKLTVTVDDKTATSTSDFTVTTGTTPEPPPAIASLSPLFGSVATEVTITGTNFGANPVVKMNNVTATIITNSATSIKFTVPATLLTGEHKVTVTSNSQTEEAAQRFTIVTPPDYQWSNKLNTSDVTDSYSGGTAFVHNGTLYMGLGTNLTTTPNTKNNNFWAYNNGVWNVASEVPAGFTLRNKALAISFNNKVYVGLGVGKNDWWLLEDPTNNNSWRELTPFPLTTQTANAFAFVANNNLYVAAVNDQGVRPFPTEIYQLRPADNGGMGSWTKVAQVAFALYWPATFVIGEEVYMGGDIDTDSNTRPFYKFNAQTNAVGRVAAIPMPTTIGYLNQRHNAFTLNGKGYVVQSDEKVYEYTPNATGGTWRIALDNPSVPDLHYSMKVNDKAYGWDFFGRVYEFQQ